MISKKLLLAGIAASAFAIATQASAITIAAKSSGANGADTSQIATNNAVNPGFTGNNPYLLASELNYNTGVQSTRGQFTTFAAIGSTLANATTYSVSITYQGATLNGPSTPQDLMFYGGNGALLTAAGDVPTNVVANGSGGTGNSGSSTATYTFSTNTSGNNPAYIAIAPAIIVKNGGNVTMTVSVTSTSTNIPVTPNATAQLISGAQGFKVVIASDTTPTYAVANPGGGAGPYTALATTAGTDAVIGRVELLPNMLTGSTNPTVYQTLTGTPVNSTGAISSETINVTGDFSALNVTGDNGATFGAPVNGSEFTSFGGPQTQTTVNGDTGAIETISVVKNSIMNAIPPSAYNATATVTLNNTMFSGVTENSSPNGAFQTVNREGYTVIVPWVASATQGAASGAVTTVRVSSINSAATAGAGGDVYAELINGLSSTRTGIAFMGRLNSGGEVAITSQMLENAFGNFVRADFRITVDTAGGNGAAGQPNGIIVKRLTVGPLGLTEMLNLNEQGTLLDHNTTTPSTVPPSH